MTESADIVTYSHSSYLGYVHINASAFGTAVTLKETLGEMLSGHKSTLVCRAGLRMFRKSDTHT